MGIGESVPRVDALQKVTGNAKFVEDLLPLNHLVAVCLGSSIANGRVISMDVEEARSLEGVVCVLTCFDIPETLFATAGHPYSLDPRTRDIADKAMLSRIVRYIGDDIAVVVARDGLIANRALSLIKVEYEECPPMLEYSSAFNGKPLHPKLFTNNVFAQLNYEIVDNELAYIGDENIPVQPAEELSNAYGNDSIIMESEYLLPPVHACHIENIACFSYMDGNRIIVVTSTQVPHIVRRIVSEAISYPLGKIRVIKPYVGGAFGNKQDIYYEPLAAYLSKFLGGQCVAFMLSREQTFVNSRTRHGMQVKTRAVFGNERFEYRETELISDQGAYAAHGHAIAANAITNSAYLYPCAHTVGKSKSIYTNRPSGGALRAYGIPQSTFVMESFIDELAVQLDCDPLEFRLEHMVKIGYVDPINGIKVRSSGLEECIRKGAELSNYHEKKREYKNDFGLAVRRGIGMAIYIYTTGLGRISLETSSIRMVLNQDGSLILQTGAVDFGQGSNTALAQMASEVLSIDEERIHVVPIHDTDVCPYDIGTFSSRVTYVAGSAVKQTAEILKERMKQQAARILSISVALLDLKDGMILRKDSGESVMSFSELASASLFDLRYSQQLTAESTFCMRENAFSFGVCFADIEVDMALGAIDVKRITSVFDSGRIINPDLAKAQVHGGISMGLGYALMEEMLFDDRGEMINNNLLDYKIPTVMDMPEMVVDFIETNEPTAPFGNKSLGEPPVIPVAPAIRNALFMATGVAMNRLPMTAQRVTEAFVEAGLLEEV